MVSASVLALSYVLFMTSLFTGERFMIEIAAIVSGSIWFAHVLYFTFFLDLAAVSERYPYVPALDEIGEKLMRRILTGFKRIRFEPMGGIQDVFVLFIISFLIRLMFPFFTRPLISLLPPIIPLVLQLIILFLSLFVVASYLLRYLTVRLDIINAYRHRKSSRSLAILHWKPTSCADKRLKDAVYALSYSIKWRSKEMPDDVIDSFGNSLLSWRVLFAREYSEGGSLANKEYWRFGTPDKPMDMTKSWDDPENLAAAVPKPLVPIRSVMIEPLRSIWFWSRRRTQFHGPVPLTCRGKTWRVGTLNCMRANRSFLRTPAETSGQSTRSPRRPMIGNVFWESTRRWKWQTK